MPFTDCPYCGTSSQLEAGEVGDSPAFSSKEEVGILSLGCERGSSLSKSRGGVDGAGHSELEVGAGGDFLAFQQVTSSSHAFSGMVPGTQTVPLALMMHNESWMNTFCKDVAITSPYI